MRILWFTWKDLKHPESGGAELVTAEMVKRLVADGHQVKIITAGYPLRKGGQTSKNEKFGGFLRKGTQDGAEVVRLGNKVTVYWQAYRYYKKNLQGWADITIEEVNTVPFFTKFYVKNAKRFLFFHQLAREIWFYQMFFPLSFIGYLGEAIYLRILSSEKVITVSESSKKDLQRYGFKKENVKIISEGVHISPVENLDEVKKYDKPTILSLGAVRKMKRTIHQLKAFEIAKKEIPDLQFKISGLVNDSYGRKFVKLIEKSPYKKDIEFMGRVSDEEKEELMGRSHLIIVTSLKEGWGLIVSEAASQGTPAVVYDVDGLRDAVEYGKAGCITMKNTPENLARKIVEALTDEDKYNTIRQYAYKKSLGLTFDKGYADLKEILNLT